MEKLKQLLESLNISNPEWAAEWIAHSVVLAFEDNPVMSPECRATVMMKRVGVNDGFANRWGILVSIWIEEELSDLRVKFGVRSV